MQVCEVAEPQVRATPADKARAYIEDVLSGRIVVCKYVRQAIQWHEQLDTGQDRGLWFDEKAASNALRFVELLRQTQGEWVGKPLLLEPWGRLSSSGVSLAGSKGKRHQTIQYGVYIGCRPERQDYPGGSGRH